MKSASSLHSNDSMNMKKKKKKNRNKNKSTDLSMEALSQKSQDRNDIKRVVIDITTDDNAKSEESKTSC